MTRLRLGPSPRLALVAGSPDSPAPARTARAAMGARGMALDTVHLHAHTFERLARTTMVPADVSSAAAPPFAPAVGGRGRRAANGRFALLTMVGLGLGMALAVPGRAAGQNASPLPPKSAPATSSQGLTNSAVSPGKTPAPPPERERQKERHPPIRLFPAERLGELEGPDRELWQKPDQIMDALGIADGSVVADLGAGGGWFTVRLARRVGPQGIVFAEDVQEQMIESIERRIQREGLRNVRTVLGTLVDPKLPRPVQAMLIVETFNEVENPVALLRRIREQLLPNGRLGIVEFRKDGGGPGPPLEERVDESVVLANAEAAGLRLIARETFLPYQYLLVFGRQEATTPANPTRQSRY